MSEAAFEIEIEPSPFDGVAPPRTPVRRYRSGEPLPPLTSAELDDLSRLPPHVRTLDPWKCAFNRAADDGIGHMSGMGMLQCTTRISDPTAIRYCVEHAIQLGLPLSPTEAAQAAHAEVSTNLTRLAPRALKTLESVMDDDLAPAGVRSKAATEVLDRSGHRAGVDINLHAEVNVTDITAVIQERLSRLRGGLISADAEAGAELDVAEAEIVSDETTVRQLSSRDDSESAGAGAGAGGDEAEGADDGDR